jgi:mono/diheme cytochrome c family protein
MRALGLALLALIALSTVGCGSSEPAAIDCSENSQGLATDAITAVPCWTEAEQLPSAAVPGAKLFATSGCLACHRYLGLGGLAAPALSSVGARRSDVSELEHVLADPPQGMQSYASLGEKRLHQLAVFLAASKGAQ